MASLDLKIDSEVLARARQRALEEGTTLDTLIRDYLVRYVDGRDQAEAMRAFIEDAAALGARSAGPWTREDLHDRNDRGDSNN
jgi:hypothetical protein